MVLNTDWRTAVQLTAAARARIAAISAALPLTAWLPNRDNPTLSYTFDASGKTQVDIAEFRAFDTEAPYGKTSGTITKEGKLPPISRKLPVSEYTELQYSQQGDALGGLLDTYAGNLGQGFAFRLELARAEAIRTGKLVLAENGLTATIDYGRAANQTVTLTGTHLWSNAASTPVDDVLAWRAIQTANDGTPGASALLTLDVLDALSKNADIIKFAVGRTDNLPSRISYTDVQSVFAQFGITSWTVVDQAYAQFNLGQTVFPAGTFVLAPAPGSAVVGGSLGSTEIGIPAEALQDSYGISAGERAGVFAGAFSREDPIGLDVLVSGVALPIVASANSTFYAKVL